MMYNNINRHYEQKYIFHPGAIQQWSQVGKAHQYPKEDKKNRKYPVKDNDIATWQY